MHASLKFILATLLVSSPLMASAVDEHHPEQAPTTPAQTSEAATPMQNNVMTEQMQKCRLHMTRQPPPRPLPSDTPPCRRA